MILSLLAFMTLAMPQDERGIDALVESLGDASPDVRAAAAERLRSRIKEALPALRKAARNNADPQIRAAAASLVAPFSAGAVLWKYECGHGGRLIQPLRLLGQSKGVVAVACGCVGEPLVGLDEATGVVRWQADAGPNVSRHYTFAGELVLATLETRGGRITAIETTTGKKLWSVDGKGMLHRPMLAGDRVFAGGTDGVRSIDATTGDVKWLFPSVAWVSTPTVGDKLVIASSFDRTVRAIHRDSGLQAWEFQAGERPSNAAIAGDRVLVGGAGRLFCLGLRDGQKQWECAVEGVCDDAPVVAGSVVYYKSRYTGAKSEGGGYPTLYQDTAADLATGQIKRQQADPIRIPELGHAWVDDTAVDESSRPLKEGVACVVAGCDGTHRLAATAIQVGPDEVKLYAAGPRLRVLRDMPAGDRLITLAGGFPVYSGRRYDGPRRSAVVCIRAIDADR